MRWSKNMMCHVRFWSRMCWRWLAILSTRSSSASHKQGAPRMASRIASTARRAAGLALLDWRHLAIAVKELLLAPGFAMPANKSGKSCVSWPMTATSPTCRLSPSRRRSVMEPISRATRE